jgi:hypothetical protein
VTARHRIGAGLAAFASLTLAASAAAQIDLTGTYEGRVTCVEILDDGTGEKFKESSTLEITQIDEDEFLIDVDGQSYQGRLIVAAQRPDRRGAALALACGTSDDPSSDGAIATLDVRANPNSGRVRIRGGVSFFEAFGFGGCKGNWKRTDDTDPEALGCE